MTDTNSKAQVTDWPIGEAEVVIYDPRADIIHNREPRKIIDASLHFMEISEVGDRLYSKEQVEEIVSAALSAQEKPEPGVAVPDGWKLVPVEPTMDERSGYRSSTPLLDAEHPHSRRVPALGASRPHHPGGAPLMTPEPGREALAAIVAGEPVAFTTENEMRQVQSGYYGRMQDDANDFGWSVPLYSSAQLAKVEAERDIAKREAAYMRETSIKNARERNAAEARAEAAEAISERLKLEAQGHAMEARTANSTIAEIYQVVTGSTGEPGNWHGAAPVRAAFEALRERVAVLEEALDWYGEQARLARLIHSEGDLGRWALAEDGGKRARNALKREMQNADQ